MREVYLYSTIRIKKTNIYCYTYPIHNLATELLKGHNLFLIVGDYTKPFKLKPRSEHTLDNSRECFTKELSVRPF